MKKFAKFFLAFSVLVILLICTPVLVHAQSGPGDPNCDPLDPACPIDSGVGMLLAAGIGYGIKKAKDFRKMSRLL